MPCENTVLSLNPDGHTLLSKEVTLRANSFAVISVSSPLQARFEVEMGRCGISLTSYITPLAIYHDLAGLFSRSCPGGLVVSVAHDSDDHIPVADIVLSDRDEPNVIVQRIRLVQAKKAG
jgi:hypothetical protein